jgi:hypothetical protein
VVTRLNQTSVAAGGAFTVFGTGFNNPGFCGNSEVSLVSGSTAYTQATLSGSDSSINSAVNSCVPPGTYNVVVRTAVGKSSNYVPVRVTAPSGAACPSDNNECTEDVCQNGACVHLPTSFGSCSIDGLTGTCGSGECCANGKCSTSTSSQPPACVQATTPPTAADENQCVEDDMSGPHCCSTGSSPAVCNYGVCLACIPHGAGCGTAGPPGVYTCCSSGDACVADPNTAATTCNVPSD